MGIKIVAKVEHHFDEEAREWEGTMTPTLLQTYEGYYTCPEHGTLHEDDLTEEQPDGTSGRCPKCNQPVDHKEDTVIDLPATQYLAGSICEVHSAIETNLLVMQRRCEEEGENLRQAEHDRENGVVQIRRLSDEEAKELQAVREEIIESDGLNVDLDADEITRRAELKLAERGKEQDAEPKPEAS